MYQLSSATRHSILEGVGYRPSSVLTKTEGHVSIIKDNFLLTTGLNFEIPISVFLHHLLENHILMGKSFIKRA